MLKSIRLKNFKLHEDTTIEAAPITVFIGPNNSGKSSIFQALLGLRQAVAYAGTQFLYSAERQPTSATQPYLFTGPELINLGPFDQVVRHGKKEIELLVSGTVQIDTPIGYLDGAEVAFTVRIRRNALTSHSGRIVGIVGSGTRIDWDRVVGSPVQPRLSVSVDGARVHFVPIDNFQLIQPVGYDPPPGAHVGSDVVDFSNSFASAPRELLKSVHPVFPLRGFEEWGYPLPQKKPESLEHLTLVDRGTALAGILGYNRRLEEQLSNRLSALLGVKIRVELVENWRATVWAESSEATASRTLFLNEGTGAAQLPFILIPIGLAKANETVLLCEPEAHLHPKAQSDLTSLLLQVTQKENLQLFIETHSEHVLHKLLHAVANGELEKKNVAIYYFKLPEKGVAKVQKLTVDDRGGVEGGLPGFYDQSLDELSEYLAALKKP